MKPNTARQITAALFVAAGLGLMFTTDAFPVGATQMLVSVLSIAFLMTSVYLMIMPRGIARLIAVISGAAGVAPLAALTGLAAADIRSSEDVIANIGYALLAVSGATLIYAGIAGTIAEDRARKTAEAVAQDNEATE
jgi:hypothetical protein